MLRSQFGSLSESRNQRNRKGSRTQSLLLAATENQRGKRDLLFSPVPDDQHPDPFWTVDFVPAGADQIDPVIS